MTPALKRYQLAVLRERIARSLVLLDLANKIDDDQLADLLTFAAQLGDLTAADSLASFQSAQLEKLQAAQAELDRLENGNTQASAAPVRSRYRDPRKDFRA